MHLDYEHAFGGALKTLKKDSFKGLRYRTNFEREEKIQNLFAFVSENLSALKISSRVCSYAVTYRLYTARALMQQRLNRQARNDKAREHRTIEVEHLFSENEEILTTAGRETERDRACPRLRVTQQSAYWLVLKACVILATCSRKTPVNARAHRGGCEHIRPCRVSVHWDATTAALHNVISKCTPELKPCCSDMYLLRCGFISHRTLYGQVT